MYRESQRVARLRIFPRANPFVVKQIRIWPTAHPEQARALTVVREVPIPDDREQLFDWFLRFFKFI